MDAAAKTLGAGQVDGVIYVTAHGLPTMRAEDAIDQLRQQGVTTVDKLRSIQLAEEKADFLRFTQTLSSTLRSGRRLKWLIVTMNKSDLCDDERTALNHYVAGDFGNVVQRLHSEVGKNNLQIEFTTVCAYPSAFQWGGSTIQPTSSLADKDASIAKLLALIESFCD